MLRLAIVLLGSGAAMAQNQPQKFDSYALGKVDFPVSCSEQAGLEFNRAVALLHHMTYPQARSAFQHVTDTDPQCAMAHWGIAMTLFQPLWPTRPGPAELHAGWNAVQKAKALEPPTERERLFVDCAEAFFREPDASDYWQRIRRWERAMERLHMAFPRDPEATTFYALAHLAAAPAGETALESSQRAADLLLSVYDRNPDHPGAMHYLVHANDAPGRERESLEIIRKYETVAPRNPHALHMPTHIYTRLGDWDAVIRGNLRAAEAALEHPAGDHEEFVWDEFPHAIEYLIYAYLQQGADEEAAAQLRRLQETAGLQPTFKTAFHLASTRARYALERHAWDEAAMVVPREPPDLDWDRFAWPEAVAWFARGLGAAREGGIDEARRAEDRLEELESAAGRTGEELFARHIRMLRLELSAWLAHREEDTTSGIALLREAAALEASTPKHAVTPAPTLPAYELLGDLFVEQGRAAEALAAYQQSLKRYPRRFNSLLGAARAARSSAHVSVARGYYRELLEVAAGGTRRSALEEARSFVAKHR
ncbi:MAG: tetratricopeptide repeat protein [Gammaproteobacteria bacterium]